MIFLALGADPALKLLVRLQVQVDVLGVFLLIHL